MLKIINLKNQGGLTLIEIVVATALFSMVSYAAVATFQGVMKSQRSTVISQNVQESMRYALEIMGKEMRMAQKRISGDCILSNNNRIYDTNDVSGVGDSLSFINSRKACVTYSLVGGRLRINRFGEPSSYYITPDDIVINDLSFRVVDEGANTVPPSVHPRVTITLEASMAGGAGVPAENVRLETTISARSYQ
ncbi:MAG: prepilin-type N-terminal cleavage/methylation domain-containing protein [Candidatus Falkowbacteria bacterium]